MSDCIDLLLHVVRVGCDCGQYLDSMGIWTYADAIRYLAEHGRVSIVSDHGSRVKATIVEGGKHESS